MIVLGNPCEQTTLSKNNLAIRDASNVFEHGMKWAIFENWSTTTKIESCFLWVLGRPRTKSMLKSCHGRLGTGSGVYRPVFCLTCFAKAQVRHCPTILATSLFRLGQKNWSSTNLVVLWTPKCPARPLACNSQIKKSRREVWGTHNFIPLKRYPS